MPRLSLCMIVKNEESFLPGCLESVKDVVDEIILVDTGSTDKTVEIARSYGAKVFFLEWKNDFSIARNESIKHATGDWILVLDADERLNPGQKEKIRKYLNLSFDGLYVRILNTDKDGKTSIAEYPRLFRKKSGVKFERKIHEQISPSILKVGGKFAKTDITITHLGYAQDDETMRKKYERNLQILLEEFQENPNDAYTCYHIGITKILMQEKEEGIKFLEKAISIPKEISNLGDSLRAQIYNILGRYEIQIGNISQALEYFVKSSKLAPVQVSSYYQAGLVYMRKSNFTLAKNFFEKALKNLHSVLRGKTLDIAFENLFEPEEISFKLGICYFKEGNLNKVKEHLLKFISSEQLYTEFIDFLVEEYKNGNKNAIQLIRYISGVKPSFYIFKVLSGISQVEGDLEMAVNNLKLALQFKDDDEIRYNLGVCLAGLSKFNEAIDVLKWFGAREDSRFFYDAIKLLALLYLSAGEFQNALSCYELMLKHNPTDELIKARINSIAHKLTIPS